MMFRTTCIGLMFTSMTLAAPTTKPADAAAPTTEPAATQKAADPRQSSAIKYPVRDKHLPPAPPEWAADLTVLPEILYVDNTYSPYWRQVMPMRMIQAWIYSISKDPIKRYNAAYEDLLQHPEKLEEHKRRIRQTFLDQIGGLPTEGGPLNPVITRTQEFDEYRIEFLYFESLPGVYNTAMLYLPKTPAPYPAVIVACGHVGSGKGGKSYQRACKLLVRNGIAALMYDPFEQGERKTMGGTGHTVLHAQSIPLGRAAARTWVWDGMRAVDYLQTRSDIIHDRIGATGNSGGGTGSAYVSALEPRIYAGAPSCFISGFEALLNLNTPTDGEQTVHALFAKGVSHPEFFMMRSPRPSMICAAARDYAFPIKGARDTFQRAKKIYEMQGVGDRMEMTEADVAHGFHPPLRAGMVKFMRRWLLDKTDEMTPEPPDDSNPVLTDEEVRVTPGGSVGKLPNARTVYDYNIEYDKQLAVQRAKFWKETPKAQAIDEVRKLTGIRRLQDIPQPEVVEAGSAQRWGFQVQKLILKPAKEIYLPANVYVPAKPSGQAYLYLHQDGKWTDANDGGPIEQLVRQGHLVMAMDIRGAGETLPPRNPFSGFTEWFGHDTNIYFWMSEFNICYLGVRAEDILAGARFLSTYQGKHQMHVMSVGHMGPIALHAAALEPELFATVTLKNSLVSWSNQIAALNKGRTTFPNLVFNSAKVYDLPDLVETLPKEQLIIVEPYGADAKPLGALAKKTPAASGPAVPKPAAKK